MKWALLLPVHDGPGIRRWDEEAKVSVSIVRSGREVG